MTKKSLDAITVTSVNFLKKQLQFDEFKENLIKIVFNRKLFPHKLFEFDYYPPLNLTFFFGFLKVL